MLAAVATRMPKKPDMAEQNAPNAKAPPPELDRTLVDDRQQDRHEDDHMASTLYSRLRNAMAPSRTAAPISSIRAVPGSCLLIHCVFHQANSRATRPQPKAAYSRFMFMVKRFSCLFF
jgi:hypothetical protein